MCQVIRKVTYKGVKEIKTIDDLREEYPDVKLVLAYGHDEVIGCSCLCHIDIEKTLEENKIPYTKDGCMGYYLYDYVR